MMQLHPLLVRQLKRAGVAVAPARGPLATLLEHVSRTYHDVDSDRYTAERALDVVSDEMQALQENQRRRHDAIHEATIEAAFDGVCIVDGDRRVLSVNRCFAEMWRVPDEVCARGDRDEIFAHAARLFDDAEAMRASIESIYADPLSVRSDVLQLTDGRIVERRTRPVIADDGAVLGRVWFFHDVTERARHEQELRQAKEAAERASAAKSIFLGNMSHELRTPLNSILGFSRLLDGSALEAENKEYVEWIIKAGEHMLGLVNDLLDLRRLEDDRFRLEHGRVTLRGAVDEAIALVRPLLRDRRHQVSVDVAGAPPCVWADKRAVVQILVNLLSNAGKFTPDGGRIEVRALLPASDSGHVEVAVVDNGIGIDAPDLARLFTYYTQVGGKTDHKMKGSGIGLALTRALVAKLGGEIGVESTPGSGSTFRFTLQAAPG